MKFLYNIFFILYFLSAVAAESYAFICHVVPNLVHWSWLKVTKQIQIVELQATVDKVTMVAYLTLHGYVEGDSKPLLLCHGDLGHPSSLLPLVHIAKEAHVTSFSLHIPSIHRASLAAVHAALVRQAIDVIEASVKERCGRFDGLLTVGHSRGAQILAQLQFVENDRRICATCAIAGPLRCNDNGTSRSHLLQRIENHLPLHPTYPLFQIIPTDDWNDTQDSMAVRPEDHCYFVPAYHLNALYHPTTHAHFAQFLKEFHP